MSSTAARVLLSQLRDRADEHGHVADDLAVVAACSGLPVRVAHRALGELLASGAVTLESTTGAVTVRPDR